MYIVIPLVVLWIACAIPAYGLLFAALDRQSSFMARSQERRNQKWAIGWALFAGPTILALCAGDKANGYEGAGWKWRREYDA